MKKVWKVVTAFALAVIMMSTVVFVAKAAETDDEAYAREWQEWFEGCFNVNNVGGLGSGRNGAWDAEAFLVQAGDTSGGYGLPNTSDYFEDPIYPELPFDENFQWEEFEWPAEGVDSDTLGWATNHYVRGNVWKSFGSVILTYEKQVDNTLHHFEICVCIDRYLEDGEATGLFRIAKLYDVSHTLDELRAVFDSPNNYTIKLKYFHANDYILPHPKHEGEENIDTSFEVNDTITVSFTNPVDEVLPTEDTTEESTNDCVLPPRPWPGNFGTKPVKKDAGDLIADPSEIGREIGEMHP